MITMDMVENNREMHLRYHRFTAFSVCSKTSE